VIFFTLQAMLTGIVQDLKTQVYRGYAREIHLTQAQMDNTPNQSAGAVTGDSVDATS
jgi:hypothetical protein